MGLKQREKCFSKELGRNNPSTLAELQAPYPKKSQPT